MGDTEITASHQQSQRGRGQNQDQSQATNPLGKNATQPLPIIPNVAPKNSDLNGANRNHADDDLRFQKVNSAEGRAPVHSGMGGSKTRSGADGKSGIVPHSNVYKDSKGK